MQPSESKPPTPARLKEVLHLRDVVRAADPRRPVRPTALDRLLQGFLIWLLVYLVVQGEDGALASTVDFVDTRWLRLTFLNIPLHMALTLLTAVGASSRSSAARGIGWTAALLESVLLVGHVVLTLTST